MHQVRCGGGAVCALTTFQGPAACNRGLVAGSSGSCPTHPHPASPLPLPRSALNKAIAYVAARKQLSAIRKAVRESMDSMDEADRAVEPAPAPAVGKAGRKASAAKGPSARGRRSGSSSSRELVARAKKGEGSS